MASVSLRCISQSCWCSCRILHLIILLAAIVALVTGCAPPAVPCVPASTAQVAIIADGLRQVEPGANVLGAFRVKSDVHRNAWYVAAHFTVPGVPEGAVGLWLVSGLPEQPGTVLSVDHIALNFSPWPDGTKSDAQASQLDPSAQRAEKCAGGP